MGRGYLRMGLYRFTHLSDDHAVAKMGHPVFAVGENKFGERRMADLAAKFALL